MSQTLEQKIQAAIDYSGLAQVPQSDLLLEPPLEASLLDKVNWLCQQHGWRYYIKEGVPYVWFKAEE